jgi:hypothetical protein
MVKDMQQGKDVKKGKKMREQIFGKVGVSHVGECG